MGNKEIETYVILWELIGLAIIELFVASSSEQAIKYDPLGSFYFKFSYDMLDK